MSKLSSTLNSSWILEEFSAVSFGDKRLDKRLLEIGKCFSDNPTLIIPSSCCSWRDAKAAYRFFDNPKVTADKVIAPHIASTQKRMANEKVVLMVQDTSVIDYSHREASIEGMGHLFRESDKGFLLHPTIAFTPNRRCLGVANLHRWIRETIGTRALAETRNVHEKETQRWLDSYRVSDAFALAHPETHVINIADREADSYEFLMETLVQQDGKQHADIIVRSSYNRKIMNSEKPEHLLWNKLRNTKVVKEICFTLPNHRKYQRPTKHITQTLRVSSITLKPCRNKKRRGLKPVKLTAVLCTEKNPPEGAKPLEWLLLTSIQLNDKVQAETVVEYYLCRWQIEVYFKTLKTGCKIQSLQLYSYEKLSSCIALYMVIAWRIMFMTMIARHAKTLLCTVALSHEEWTTAYTLYYRKPPPDYTPTLYEIIRLIGKLGGFLGRKSDGEPGPKAIWIGMTKIQRLIT